MLRARYAALFEGGSAHVAVRPATDKSGISPELIAESLARRPVLLIGDVGVGKSTFIRHLIKVDATELFEQALTFYVDLGSRAALTQDLRQFFVDDLTSQLQERYGINTEGFDFVRAVYHGDLQRFEQGIYKELRKSNPERYQEKELEFIESKLAMVDQHLRVSLKHLERSRRKQIVVFIDNADQRDDATQQAAFIVAQELTEHWSVMVFLALRPETFYRSLREGALSGYHPKAFTISPPRVDVVLGKRIALGIRIAEGEIPLSALGGDYRIKLEKLSVILKVFQQSLETGDELISAIDNIAAGNIRQALEFVRTFLGSGHVDTERIVEAVETGGASRVAVYEFLRAIILGDSRYYDPARSPIANLFDISSAETREHFLLGALLQSVQTRAGVEGQSGFVSSNRLYATLQDLEFRADQIDFALRRALEKNLLQAERPDWNVDEPEGALRLTSKGAYHLAKLPSMYTYHDAIVVDTPVLDEGLRRQIHDVEGGADRVQRILVFRQYLDAAWAVARIPSRAFDWPTRSALLAQQIRAVEASRSLRS